MISSLSTVLQSIRNSFLIFTWRLLVTSVVPRGCIRAIYLDCSIKAGIGARVVTVVEEEAPQVAPAFLVVGVLVHCALETRLKCLRVVGEEVK